jgi:hypothetical protein
MVRVNKGILLRDLSIRSHQRRRSTWKTLRQSVMVKRNILDLPTTGGRGVGPASSMEQGSGSRDRVQSIKQQEGQEDWAMKNYKGKALDEEEDKIEDSMLELDVDKEEATERSKVLGYCCLLLEEEFHPHVLFSYMIQAWSLHKLACVEKIGDYTFKVEFVKEEEKKRVLEGGPWRHKGDTLIVVHYDGLIKPSEIRIQSIGLWVRLYDLTPAMMKHAITQLLGEQLGEFIRLDSKYPGYLRIRVNYHLSKHLMLELTMKVKGHEQMLIITRYENVPHFCFAWHRACNNKFVEELWASPPRHIKEIAVKAGLPKAARPLFQVMEPLVVTRPTASGMKEAETSQGRGGRERM